MRTAGLARALLVAVALGCALVAQAQIAVPALTARVIDQTMVLAPEQKAALEQTLQAFEARKGSQIAVLIVPTTAPETIEQYAIRVAEQWKLGRKNIDDGALLLVAKDDRTLRIEVGYGLEGALNDATAKRIVAEIITPRFKQGDFHGGISAGVERMIGVIEGEPLPAPKRQPAAGDTDVGRLAPVLLVLVIVAGGVLRRALGRVPGALVTGGAAALVAWLVVGALSIALVAGAIALLFTLAGAGMGRHGGWLAGGRGHGGFGSGGFGHSGFGGRGGGFGGGGASGRW